MSGTPLLNPSYAWVDGTAVVSGGHTEEIGVGGGRVELSGGTYKFTWASGFYVTGDTSNLVFLDAHTATFEVGVTENTYPTISGDLTLAVKIHDGGLLGVGDYAETWWLSGTGVPAPSVVFHATVSSGDFVVHNVYDNACVAHSISAGYSGLVTMTQYPGFEPTFDISFANLDDGAYTVFVDDDGGLPGGFDVIGTFTAVGGVGSFGPSTPSSLMHTGTNTWSIWVNGGGCGSVLQTDSDLSFTLP